MFEIIPGVSCNHQFWGIEKMLQTQSQFCSSDPSGKSEVCYRIMKGHFF
jgi:hypothetical protein